MFRMIKQLVGIILWVFITTTICSALDVTYEITGIQDPALKNAYNRLKIDKDNLGENPTQEQWRQFIEDGPKEIMQSITPYGLFKAEVSTKVTHETKDKLQVTYHVSPGHPLKITSLNVTISGPGKDNKALKKFLANLKLQMGDTFNTDIYEDTKEKMLDLAQDQGYLKAKFKQDSVLINLRYYACAINIDLDTGPRYYFGHITFEDTPLNEAFLRRFLVIKYGEPFSYNKLINQQQLISGGGYFSLVDVAPVMENEKNQRVPIRVGLKMQKRKSYNFGIGYGTYSGFRATIGYNVKWVNKWGHQFRADARLAKIETNVAAQYIIPGKDPIHTKYTLNAGVYTQKPDTGESFTTSVGVGYIRNYTFWQRALNLNYEWERYRVQNTGPYDRSRILMPSIAFSRTVADNTINTQNGSQFTITLRGATTAAASTVNFIQSDIQYKWIKTFWENNRVILRADWGYTIVKDLSKLPLSKRFYAGGMDSIRGYKFKSIGPGRYLGLASGEYQHRIYQEWFGAAFYDIGNAMDHWDGQWYRSVGVGVVWHSPVGALRMYVARPLDTNNHNLRFEFSLGPNL